MQARAETDAPAGPGGASPNPVSGWPMWVLGLVLMIDQIDQNIVRGVVPQLQDEFGLSDTEIGVLLSIFVLVNGVITVPAGYLADRWRRTRAIGHTVVAWSAITALTAGAQSFGHLLGLRALLGFGQGVTEPSAASLIGDYYPSSHRGRAFSLQQVLMFSGFGLGIGLGGAVGTTLGWRWAFLIVALPGTLVALAAYRLREPRRGHADLMHLGLDADPDAGAEHPRLFEDGFRRFVADMWTGLVADMRTILAIPTLRLSLVGVGVLLFSITAIGAWLPVFHERFSGLTQREATGAVMAIVIVGGIPGILLGGRLADRYAGRVQGARVVIPAWCVMVATVLFTVSYLDIPFAAAFALELVGFFVVVMAIPALRAGLTDVVPANLRGAGFGAFNVVSVVFGAAAAPVIVGLLAEIWDLRTAFLVISPPLLVGALILFRARYHLDEDAAKILEAVMRAVQEQQARTGQPSGKGMPGL